MSMPRLKMYRLGGWGDYATGKCTVMFIYYIGKKCMVMERVSQKGSDVVICVEGDVSRNVKGSGHWFGC